MADHPSIAEQVQAVEWLEAHFRAVRNIALRTMSISQADKLIRALEAAADTLRTLEYGAAIAR